MKTARKVIFFLLVGCFLVPLVLASKVYATSCSVTVSPNTAYTSASTDLDFIITNNGSNPVVWVKVTRLSTNFTITGSNSGAAISQNANDITFTGFSANPGDSPTLSVVVTAGSSVQPAASWQVQAAEDDQGNSAADCSGDTGVSITTAPLGAPAISSLTISDVSDTAAKISWTTDQSADSLVNYGKTSAYGSSVNSGTQTTTHSLSITGLTANTTYHFQVQSANDNGTTQSSDNTFATAKQGASVTTQTVTKTVNQTVTVVKQAPDTTPPVVTVTFDFSKSYKDSPQISGTAIDDHEVDLVEYSLDNGRSWLSVKQVTNLGSPAVKFSLTPAELADGQYSVIVRATDKAGNVGQSNRMILTVDRTPPVVSLVTSLTQPFKAAPDISGQVKDPSGVGEIEYSLDGGKTFLPVDETEAVSGNSNNFSFAPGQLEDDTYPLVIRARDQLGNVGITRFGNLVIDRLPPIVGGNVLLLAPYVLSASDQGEYVIPVGEEAKLVLSSVGGPTAVQVLVKQAGGEGQGGERAVSLAKDTATGLWSTTLSFSVEGSYMLAVTAVDGAGQKTSRQVGSVLVLPLGRVLSKDNSLLSGAKLTVFSFDDESQQFIPWQGSFFSQTNPQFTDENGNYKLFLPPGTYYLAVSSPDFRPLTTTIFTLAQSRPVNFDLFMEPSALFNVGPWRFSLFDFGQTLQTVNLGPLHRTLQNASGLVGKPLPEFKLKNENSEEVSPLTLHGKMTLVTLLNTWSPQAAAQLAIFDQVTKDKDFDILVVVPEEPPAKVLAYQRRGGYLTSMIADPDGTLVEPLQLGGLPMHLLVANDGIIRQVKMGVLTLEQIADLRH